MEEMEPRAGPAGNGHSIFRDRLANHAPGRWPVYFTPSDTRNIVAHDMLTMDGNGESA